jgi:predicted transcriptional regulator
VKATTAKDKSQQLQRFKEMARELGADESPDALDRALARLDMKKKETAKLAKRTAKAK